MSTSRRDHDGQRWQLVRGPADPTTQYAVPYALYDVDTLEVGGMTHVLGSRCIALGLAYHAGCTGETTRVSACTISYASASAYQHATAYRDKLSNSFANAEEDVAVVFAPHGG